MERENDILYDLGFERAETVFTTLRFRRDVGFHFVEDHYPRLIDGCRAQGIDIAQLPSFEAMCLKIQSALDCYGYAESVVKLFVTPGYSADGIVPDGPPKFFVTVRPFVPRALGPFRLEVQEGEREIPEIKIVGQYVFVRQRLARAKANGSDEFLYRSSIDGSITESPFRNIFLCAVGVSNFLPHLHVCMGLHGILL